MKSISHFHINFDLKKMNDFYKKIVSIKSLKLRAIFLNKSSK